MDFLKETRFERLGAFIFSPEEGARAHTMPDPVPQHIKTERFNAVMEQQQEISRELNDSLSGKTLKVLVDEKDPNEDGLFYGRTEADAPEVDNQVNFRSSKALQPGDFVDVCITDALEYDLVGAHSA